MGARTALSTAAQLVQVWSRAATQPRGPTFAAVNITRFAEASRTLGFVPGRLVRSRDAGADPQEAITPGVDGQLYPSGEPFAPAARARGSVLKSDVAWMTAQDEAAVEFLM